MTSKHLRPEKCLGRITEQGERTRPIPLYMRLPMHATPSPYPSQIPILKRLKLGWKRLKAFRSPVDYSVFAQLPQFHTCKELGYLKVGARMGEPNLAIVHCNSSTPRHHFGLLLPIVLMGPNTIQTDIHCASMWVVLRTSLRGGWMAT